MIIVVSLLISVKTYGGDAQMIFNKATEGTTEILFEGVIERERLTFRSIQDKKIIESILAKIQFIDPDEGLGEITEDTIFLSCFCVPDNFITFKKEDGSFVALGTKHGLKEIEFLQLSETPKLPRLKVSKKTTKKLSHIIKKAKKELANQASHTMSVIARPFHNEPLTNQPTQMWTLC